MSDQAMIEMVAVSKWFGDLVAVSDVTFEVGPGVTALLGPNGAGKSTVLRMMSGLASASSGTVRVLGGDPRTDAALRGRMGLVPQQEQLFEHLRAVEFVEVAARLQRVPDPREAARRCLGRVDLDADDQRPVSTYSKGMRQRVKVAQAIVHDPEVLLLDEPLTGLDPRQRAHLIEVLEGFGAAGVCVLVSSHVLEEVERFGSNVLVIAQGRLAAQGDFREIRALMDDRPLRVRVRTDRRLELASALLSEELVVGVRLDDDRDDGLVVDAVDAGTLSHRVAPLCRELDAELRELVPLDDDLESVFRYLVQR